MSASLRAAMATTAVVVGVGAMIAGGGSALASNHNGGDHKVTICHCNGTDYDATSVYKAAIVAGIGHGGHRDDILPPFSYEVFGKTKHYPGQGDQSILARGCSLASTTTAPATTVPEEVEEPTTTTTVPEEVEEPTTTTTVPEEVEEPTTTVPEVEEPEMTVPETTIPETTVPEVTVPKVTDPTVEAAAVTPAVTGTLPATGTGTTALAIAGFGALIAGLGLVQLASNRRQSVKA